MKIISLKAENFKNLIAVYLKLDGKGVIITGGNGAGKTNILDAIEVAFGGKKAMPKEPIRKGETSARIVIELEDIIVKRKFTEKGDYIEITNKENAVYKSPQALLDKLVGSISFDPLAFAKMNEKEQRAAMLNMLGVDLTEFEARYACIKFDRSTVLTEGKKLAVEFESMSFVEDLPEVVISMSILTTKLTETHKRNSNLRESLREIDKYEDAVLAADKEVATAIIERKRLEGLIKKQRDYIELLTSKKKTYEEDLKVVQEIVGEQEEIDTTKIDTEIREVEAKNTQIRNNKAYQDVEGKIAESKSASFVLLQKMKDIETEKVEALNKAPMPVKDLTIEADCVAYKGLSLKDGTNHTKQIEVCVAIGMAMNPKLNVMLLDINGVGPEALAAIQKMAVDHDPPYQLIMEQYDTSGKVGIYIEDGSIVDKTQTEQGDTEVSSPDGADDQGNKKKQG